MNANPLSSDAGDDVDGGGGGVFSGKKVRKTYTITKSRESWTEEEHDKFLGALHLFDRDWKRIEDFVGSKTVIQIRSHAQKYFLNVQKNGTIAHVPPARPKRKAAHPYPQKAPKNVLVPLQPSMAQPSSMNNAFVLLPGQISWDEASILMNTVSCKNIPADEIENFPGAEADIGSKGVSRINCDHLSGVGTSSRTFCSSEELEQKSKAPALHGLPDFAEVYTFIGSVFDTDIESHMQKLKEMDPINFETPFNGAGTLCLKSVVKNQECKSGEQCYREGIERVLVKAAPPVICGNHFYVPFGLGNVYLEFGAWAGKAKTTDYSTPQQNQQMCK